MARNCETDVSGTTEWSGLQADKIHNLNAKYSLTATDHSFRPTNTAFVVGYRTLDANGTSGVAGTALDRHRVRNCGFPVPPHSDAAIDFGRIAATDEG